LLTNLKLSQGTNDEEINSSENKSEPNETSITSNNTAQVEINIEEQMKES
jgi:hypothetical protein